MAPGTALQGCVISLSGRFKRQHTHGQLHKIIEENGGMYLKFVEVGCTHLVADEVDCKGGSEKVLAFRSKGLPWTRRYIVSIDWLLGSIEANSKLDEAEHLMKVIFESPRKSDDIFKGFVNEDNQKKRPHNDEEIEHKLLGSQTADKVSPVRKLKDGNRARPGSSVQVPVDQYCSRRDSQRVYIDKDAVIFDASLIQTDTGTNANKAYHLQLLQHDNSSYHTWTRRARVGYRGSGLFVGDGSLESALFQFKKKFEEKSGITWAHRLDPPKRGKFTFIERCYTNKPDDDDMPGIGSQSGSQDPSKTEDAERESVPSALSESVQGLMKFIFNQSYFEQTMKTLEYDSKRLPLGKLSARSLKAGFQALKDLQGLLTNPTLAEEHHGMTFKEALTEICNTYYTYIPHRSGRVCPPLIDNTEMLKNESELLESLSEMFIADEIMQGAELSDDRATMNYLDRRYAGLRMTEMTARLSPQDKYTTSYTKLEVEEIFRIERQDETRRFLESRYGTLNADRRLLWHGSRCTNFAGILSRGLRIAPLEAPSSGYMFDKGVYLADASSKSAKYCHAHGSGNVGLLLLCDAELGKPMLERTHADAHAYQAAKKQRRLSTWGKGIKGPVGWKDASCIHANLEGVMMPDISQPFEWKGAPGTWLRYNEYVAYDPAQIRLRYLFKVNMA